MGFGNALSGKTPFGAGSYLNENCEVVVEVTANKAKQSENNPGAFNFITEFKITEVLASDASSKLTPGLTYSQVININKRGGPEDCVAFLAAGAGVDPYNTPEFETAVVQAYQEAFEIPDLNMEKVADLVCDENQPLVGLQLRLQIVNKPNKSNPEKFFSKHMWFPTEATE